ncbi:MAG: thiamine pyridinylase [Lachnospiraceae bacterium]|nr:thiamine pyridinylase [Lachnospiraceae bacterium]
MNKRNILAGIRKGIFLLLAVTTVFTGCGQQRASQTNLTKETEQAANSINKSDDAITLSVALFPYVPDVEYFEKVITDTWKSDVSHDNVNLEFITDWDCYSSVEVPDEYDIVVLDAIYLREYAEKGELLAVNEADINDYEDILPFVREGLKVDGTTYGMPEMICANLFFYRSEDTDVAQAGNVDKLYEVMGSYEYTQAEPEKGKGLIIDMSSGTGNICLYLDAITDEKAVYSDFAQMPDLENIDEGAVQSLNELILMAGEKGAYYETGGDYDRAGWFGSGSGRTYIGYSESMAQMGVLDDVKVSTLSLADREDIPLFYVDVAAINSNLSMDERKKEYALELLNVIAGSDVITQTIKRDNNCQFILPARSSCYLALKEDFPIYKQLEAIVQNSNNHVFRMGADAHEYIKKAKEILPYYLLGDE